MRMLRLSIVGWALASGLVAIACGDDADGGSSTTGGAAGADASAGTGGKGGSSGAGGSTSAGGSSGSSAAGGVSGSGGLGGSSGAAMDAADAPGDVELDSPGDVAIDATDAADGAAGSAAFTKCSEKCTSDSDCTGPTGSHICDQFGRCRAANSWSSVCASDSDCIAQGSNWNVHCKSDADCLAASNVCVNIGGGIGKCAPTGTALFCSIAPDKFEMPKIDGSGNILVCGDADFYKCHPLLEQCLRACANSADCASVPSSPTCSNGFCGCTKNTDCTASGYCNPITAYCGCNSNTDCPASNPACVNGTCGCNAPGDCPKLYTGSSVACE